jgi:hypothetical protein
MTRKQFNLIDKMVIKNPTLNVIKENKCFMYDFKKAGINIKSLTKWLNGKIIEVYEFTGRFGKTTTCPWCGSKELDEDHIASHGKSQYDLETIKLSKAAYPVLLWHTRNGNYDESGDCCSASSAAKSIAGLG